MRGWFLVAMAIGALTWSACGSAGPRRDAEAHEPATRRAPEDDGGRRQAPERDRGRPER